MRSPRNRAGSVAVLFAFCLSVVGCGPDRPETYPTKGRVLFDDGTPVMTGTIELLSEEFGETASGRIEDDGSFVLGTFDEQDGACSGRHDVVVIQMIINDGVTTHNRDHGPAVDPIYATYETSGLAVEIEPVEQNDIEVTVQKRRP